MSSGVMNSLGSGIWYIIHRLALRITSDEDISKFEAFMIDLQEIIPCSECRSNYELELTTLLRDMSNTYVSDSTSLSIFDLTVDMHNNVNRRLRKRVISTIEALSIYDIEHRYDYLISTTENRSRKSRNVSSNSRGILSSKSQQSKCGCSKN